MRVIVLVYTRKAMAPKVGNEAQAARKKTPGWLQDIAF